MDFKKFQQWCENKGFVVKMPSGYSKLINLEVSSFESFKGIFNLCMLFFYEELYKQRNEETEINEKEILAEVNKANRNGRLFVVNPDKIFRSNYNQTSYPSSRRYSDEDIQKVFNSASPSGDDADYLLTPNDDGTTPMDGLLTVLENKTKYENYKLKPSKPEKSSKFDWCDIGKEDRNKEYEDSELKSLVDKVAEKYDSED